jgi:hypothetical protein
MKINAEHDTSTHAGHGYHPSRSFLWTLGTAGALTLSPYVLPLVGIQSYAATDSYMHFMGGHVSENAFGNGLAGLINQGLSHIPLLGPALTSTSEVVIPGLNLAVTAGTLTSIAATACLGVGGVLLANWLEKRETPTGGIPWSKIIRYSALASSMLIAMPSILGGISVGMMFLAATFSSGFASHVGLALKSSIGATSMGGGASGLMAMVPHLFTCGFSLLPAGLALLLSGKRPQQSSADTIPKSTYEALLLPSPPPEQGRATTVAFQLRDSATGRPLGDDELKVLHTRPLHTMVVDSSLRDYHHLHPTYDPARKAFVCAFTPALQGSYAMWNDFTVKGEAEPTYLKTEIGARRSIALPARVEHTSSTEANGLTVRLTSDQRLSANSDAMLTVDVRDKAGNPVTDLEPIMGAYAHLVGFSTDGKHFIHSHPLGPEPQSAHARGASPLEFHVAVPECSGIKFFLQVQRNGTLVTLPFGQQVAQQPAFSKRPMHAAQGHGHMAVA